MLWGVHQGGLELRRDRSGETRLRGRFPYGQPAVLSDGGRSGRPQKEIIASRAFSYRVEDPDEDIHLLLGHDYDHPLASKGTGTLSLRDTAEALVFEAVISRTISETSYGRDALAMIGAGLAVGISPGFRVPPKRAVPDAEDITDEPDRPEEGMHRAIIRTIKAALLYELSVVTRPAYPQAQVEARDWQMRRAEKPDAGLRRALDRWRL